MKVEYYIKLTWTSHSDFESKSLSALVSWKVFSTFCTGFALQIKIHLSHISPIWSQKLSFWIKTTNQKPKIFYIYIYIYSNVYTAKLWSSQYPQIRHNSPISWNTSKRKLNRIQRISHRHPKPAKVRTKLRSDIKIDLRKF